MGGGGSGPERGQIDDANAVERQSRIRRRLPVLAGRPRFGSVGLTERGSVAQRRGCASRHQPRGTGLMKSRRVAHERAAFRGVGGVANRRTIAQGSDRQPKQLAQLDHFGDGAFGKPRPNLLADEVAVLPSADLETQLRILGQLRAVDHRREIQPLLAGDHRDSDVAVLGLLDRRHFDGARHRRCIQQVRVQPLAALHQRDCFQHRQIQVFAGSSVLDTAAHRQRAERGEHPAHVLTQVATDRDRWSGWVAAEAGQTRPCLQRELAGGAIGVGSGPTEVGDGHDDRSAETARAIAPDRCPIRPPVTGSLSPR